MTLTRTFQAAPTCRIDVSRNVGSMLCKFRRVQALSSSRFSNTNIWLPNRKISISRRFHDTVVSTEIASSRLQLSPLIPPRESFAQDHSQDHNSAVHEANDPELLPDFALLGVRKSVRAALHEAFPNIRSPTACQTAFIPAILQRNDVILRDRTGTGKTLGLILALLSKTRATRPRLSFRERSQLAKRPITSMIIVPHRDLAFQLMQWIRQLCPHNLESSLDSIGQVCVRGLPELPLDVQVRKLREQAPHILIGTPQGILDIMEKDKGVLQIPTLDTVVLDEADYLLPVPGRHSSPKDKRNWERHPPPTLTILNELFNARSKVDQANGSTPWRWPLQAVFISATLRRHFRFFLFGKTKWMGRYSETVKLDFHKTMTITGPNSVRHHGLVVAEDGSVFNSKFVSQPLDSVEDEEARNHSTDKEEKKMMNASISSPGRVLNANLLEAIATTFALDVPKVALLVLPSSAPVKSVLEELRDMGIDARSINLHDEDRGKPDLIKSTLKKFHSQPPRRAKKEDGRDEKEEAPYLLVTTIASVRGLDFPEMTHVFLAGIPEEPDDYLHAAGRVGRFGREGKVVTFFEGKEEQKAAILFKQLKISLSEFEHVRV